MNPTNNAEESDGGEHDDYKHLYHSHQQHDCNDDDHDDVNHHAEDVPSNHHHNSNNAPPSAELEMNSAIIGSDLQHPSPQLHHSHYTPPLPPSSLPLSIHNNNNSGNSSDEQQQQLDFTRQYYEARMREHAMQYANAAAGAAWAAAAAAARMAAVTANHHYHDGSSSSHYYQQQQFHPYGGMHPPPPPPLAASYPSGAMAEYPPIMQMQQQSHSQQQQRRSLWKPPKTNNNSNYKRQSGGNDSISSSIGSNPKNNCLTNHDDDEKNSNSSSYNGASRSNGRQQKNTRKKNDANVVATNGGAASATIATASPSRNNSNSNNNNSNNHHRQKRGLQHGHSSKSSFSSIGSGNNNNSNNNSNSHSGASHHHHQFNNSNSRKKKNRSSFNSKTATSSSATTGGGTGGAATGVFLGGLIGKTGVSALHELCHKYRWEKPVYTLIDCAAAHHHSGGGGNDNGGGGGNTTNNDCSSDSNSKNNSSQIQSPQTQTQHPHEFVMGVQINKIELGRGRGDSKVAAKQDGSRKALAALVPGVVFDPNGILLDVGGGGGRSSSSSLMNHHRLSNSSTSGGGFITSMEELGPHLASQLAIGGGGGGGNVQRSSSRPSSPDHSETSSISTSVSMTKMTNSFYAGGFVSSNDNNVNSNTTAGGGVISGGPVGIMGSGGSGGGGPFRYSTNIYPCASTTSGVSSASEVEDGDENAYYASRGASVCSTLLQAMWQIDDRIRQPPSYTFDVYPIPSAKEGSTGSEQPNKRRKSGGGPSPSSSGVTKPAHRGTFQCTATLNLYFRMEEGKKDYSPSSLMESWESPLEYLQAKDQVFSSSYGDHVQSSQQESRKRKDSFASQTTQSPDRQLTKSDGIDDNKVLDNSAPKRQKVDEQFAKHTLESVATGSTKRESKHKASAKMLTLLFPECSSLVEVKAAAEAARECYAATKAMSSQTKRAKLSEKGSPERKGNGAGRSAMKRPGDNLPLTKSDDSFVSVAGLSLSEDLVADESKRIKWCESTKTETTEFDPRYECCDNNDEVDKALERCQHDHEEEPSDIDDVGKIVLCRAQPDDADFIHGLLSKTAIAESNDGNVHHKHAASDNGEVEDGGGGSNENDCPEENGDDIFLLLSRAVASHEPLGCAILTFISSPSSSLVGDEVREGPPQQRTLALRHIGHEEHLPRERFIECLEVFTSKLEDTSLDTRNIITSNDTQPILSPDGIRKCLISQSSSRAKAVTNPTTGTTSYQDEEVQLATTAATATHSLLQSVKEEDSEDALEDEGSDGGCCDVIEKAELTDGAGVNTPEQQEQHQHQQQQSKNDGKKSMRSKRRREIQHDHPHHQQNKSTK